MAWVIGLLALATLVAIVIGWWHVPFTTTQLTTDGGWKEAPRLSPDGRIVAYHWAGARNDNWDIYVKTLTQNSPPLRLTDDPANDWFPTWSPDGKRIAFVRWTKRPDAVFPGPGAIYTVPATGGQPRKVTDLVGLLFHARGGDWVPALSWSPDGNGLVFAEQTAIAEPARIVRLSLDTLEKQTLTTPPQRSRGHLQPALSPDGAQLAFVGPGSDPYRTRDIWVQRLGGGEARRVTSAEYNHCSGLGWTSDGREIVYSDGDGLLRVEPTGGAPAPILAAGRRAAGPTVHGAGLVYTRASDLPNGLWRVPGRRGSPRDRAPVELIPHARYHCAYSPDGRRIAFSAYRSGAYGIWVCDSDGTNPVHLTSVGTAAGRPAWSPDGRKILFDLLEPGPEPDWNLYTIDAEGGVARRLTTHPSSDSHGSWSRDGSWVYFKSHRSGRFEIWRIPAEGGAAWQVTRGRGEGFSAMSADGRYLYYRRRNGIWRVPPEGGEETEVLAGPLESWALTADGIYFTTFQPSRVARMHEFAIRYFDFAGGRETDLYRGGLSPSLRRGMAVSPDEKWVLFGDQPAHRSELMLLESFH